MQEDDGENSSDEAYISNVSHDEVGSKLLMTHKMNQKFGNLL